MIEESVTEEVFRWNRIQGVDPKIFLFEGFHARQWRMSNAYLSDDWYG